MRHADGGGGGDDGGGVLAGDRRRRRASQSRANLLERCHRVLVRHVRHGEAIVERARLVFHLDTPRVRLRRLASKGFRAGVRLVRALHRRRRRRLRLLRLRRKPSDFASACVDALLRSLQLLPRRARLLRGSRPRPALLLELRAERRVLSLELGDSRRGLLRLASLGVGERGGGFARLRLGVFGSSLRLLPPRRRALERRFSLVLRLNSGGGGVGFHLCRRLRRGRARLRGGHLRLRFLGEFLRRRLRPRGVGDGGVAGRFDLLARAPELIAEGHHLALARLALLAELGVRRLELLGVVELLGVERKVERLGAGLLGGGLGALRRRLAIIRGRFPRALHRGLLAGGSLLAGVFFALLGSAGGGVMGLHPSATSSKRYSMPKGSVTRSSCCSSWGLPAGIFFLFTMTPWRE